MNEVITLKSTSRNSAIGQDIELRITETSRLIFRPEIVNNQNNPDASVRGTFIFQRKKTSGIWEDYKTLDLSRLKDGEWIKLELHAGELYEFVSQINSYYKIYEEHGIRSGESSFIVTPKNVKNVILSFLNNPENFGKLQELQIDDLKKLNLISSINSLKNILTIWNSNKTNSNESFWQDFFTKNSWVIAQVFSYPVVLFKDKAYVGGKTINNQGGNVVDFIFKSGLIENILLVEIKTPTAKLLGNEYRSTYCLSNELTGSISQLLKYKDEVQKNYFNLNQLDNENFFVFDPQCLLVIGSVEGEKWSHLQKSTFTLQRHNLKNVEVITFDELFKKVEMLIELFEKE